MSDLQHCINCLRETQGFYPYPCQQCDWSPEQHGESGLYLSPGTILHNQYQIARMLGHGGFGITYLAWDNLLEIKLAIKEYLPRDFATRNSTNAEVSTFAGDAKKNFAYGLERFLEEARTLAKFQQHAGIVSVLNFFKGNGTGYMVMEYVDGLTLKDYLTDKGKLPWDQTLKLFMPVMDALREVHKHGVLHRDISPDNIYLCQDNRIKLLDFGSARYALGGHSRSLSVVVKLGYAPEEQYRGKGKQGTWTDVYSVAASMYRCVTGIVPPEALDRLDEDELLRPSELGVQIPAEAEEALMLALAVKADNRIQSIEEFQQALWEKIAVTLDKEKTAVTESVKTAMTTIEKAIVLFNLQDYEQAFCLFEYEAKRGDANAQRYLGLMYEKGQGVTQNRHLAAQWLKSADQGHASAQTSLEWLYERPKVNALKNSPPTHSKVVYLFIGLLVIALIHIYNQQASLEEGKTVAEAVVVEEQAPTKTPVTNAPTIALPKSLDEIRKSHPAIYKQGNSMAYRADLRPGIAALDPEIIVNDKGEASLRPPKALPKSLDEIRKSNPFVYGDGSDQVVLSYYRKKNHPDMSQEAFNKALGYTDPNEQGSLSRGAITAIEDGIKFYNQRNYDEAIKVFRLAAEQGDSSAENYLGIMFAKGEGVSQDFQQAVQWYRKAADQGDAKAQYNLGKMYVNGRGVQKDYQQAVQWYKKAADQGLADAETQLGLMYQNGQGVQKDYQQAVQWYQKAAEQGDAWGQFSLGLMYENGYGVGKDYKKAVQWYQKAAEQGLALGQFSLGSSYENGYGVGKDYKKAVQWYQKAADQGLALAQNNLGLMFAKGEGVQQDYQQAEQWFRKAAKQGDKDAIRALKGLGVKQ